MTTVRDFMALMGDLEHNLREQRRQFEEQKRDIDREMAERSEERAQQRRAGECGRAWQVLQQRIDMGKTTERDIVYGFDKSPEAREVRDTAAKNMAIYRKKMLADDDPDSPLVIARDQLAEEQAKLHRMEREAGL